MTRKEFLWSLGVGSLAIAGHFAIPRTAHAIAAPASAGEDPEPRLHGDVSVEVDGDGLLLSRRAGERTAATCAVNEIGAEIVRRLDGRTPVSEIARVLAGRAGASAFGEVEARVACFVAQLGELGFLRAPFYALIVERLDG